MIGIKYEGRLGNCLFQYSAARAFANRFGLILDSGDNLYMMKLAGNLVNYVIGGNEYRESKILLNDENFLSIYKSSSIDKGHYIISSGMQNPDFIRECLPDIKNTIRLNDVEKEDDSVLVHVRLGDCDNSPRRLPYGYYRDALKSCSFSTGYICSDTMDHPDVKSLIREFGLIPYQESASDILKNSGRFQKLILSEGTFSWWMGVLSDSDEIYINKRKRESLWHGDIFVFPEWKETNYCS
jgi:hypothetical protein